VLKINFKPLTQIKVMKKTTMIGLAALGACLLQACSGPKDSKASADSVNTAKADTAKKDSSMTAVDKDDAKFAVAAANGGMAEVELGTLAQQKAVNAKVKDFGGMMVTDHTKANDEMKALAKA
jgi:putative membrane protein